VFVIAGLTRNVAKNQNSWLKTKKNQKKITTPPFRGYCVLFCRRTFAEKFKDLKI